jgi:CheY-like chemotaxis protein
MSNKQSDERLQRNERESYEGLTARLGTLQDWLGELVGENQRLRQANLDLWGPGGEYSQLGGALSSRRAPASVRRPHLWPRPPRIFVVDDEATISFTMAQILVRHGFCATWFSDPFEALAFALSVTPDLLLADVMMPSLCGVELAIRMKESNPACKILLLSAQAETDDLLHGARERGHHFALHAKPIHPVQLVAEICKILED